MILTGETEVYELEVTCEVISKGEQNIGKGWGKDVCLSLESSK